MKLIIEQPAGGLGGVAVNSTEFGTQVEITIKDLSNKDAPKISFVCRGGYLFFTPVPYPSESFNVEMKTNTEKINFKEKRK